MSVFKVVLLLTIFINVVSCQNDSLEPKSSSLSSENKFNKSKFMKSNNTRNESIIDDIEKIKKPNGFELISISEILSKYISIGNSQKEVLFFLDENGFETFIDKDYEECPDADQVYAAIYNFEKNIILPPGYKAVGNFCFKNSILTKMEMFYFKNNY